MLRLEKSPKRKEDVRRWRHHDASGFFSWQPCWKLPQARKEVFLEAATDQSDIQEIQVCVRQCNFIRMLQRTHRIRWMYFEVVSQSVSPMNWFTKSWMSSRSFPPVRAVIQHAMETSSYPQEFAVLGLIMLMGLNELCIIDLRIAKLCSIAYISIRHLSRSLLPGIAQGYVLRARGFHFKPHSLSGIS